MGFVLGKRASAVVARGMELCTSVIARDFESERFGSWWIESLGERENAELAIGQRPFARETDGGALDRIKQSPPARSKERADARFRRADGGERAAELPARVEIVGRAGHGAGNDCQTAQ